MDKIKFSVVIPIHNEEKLLPYTLPCIYNLNPDEVILLLDRCTDKSRDIVQKISDMHDDINTKIFIMNDSSHDWNYRVAYLRRYGFNRTTNNIILNIDSDVIIDKKVLNYLKLISKYALISIGYWDYPFNIQTFTRRILSLFMVGFAGQYILDKSAWLETEDIDDLKNVYRAEDTHLKLAIMNKYKTAFFNTNSFHLKPNETKQRHYIRGILYWQMLKRSWYSVLIHSMLNFRGWMMIGYIHARNNNASMIGKRVSIR